MDSQMAEREEGFVSRERYQAAVRRAEEAERALEGPQRALDRGVPPELAHHFAGSSMTDEEIDTWLSKVRDYVADVVAKELQAWRPDRRRGNMLVQTAGNGQSGLKLGPGAPDWLVERLNARAR